MTVDKTDGNMLEVEVANTTPLTEPSSEGEGNSSEMLAYSNGPQNSLFSSSPIFISMTSSQDEYTVSRPSRESVLQRLSEALLRRSLTKVCCDGSFDAPPKRGRSQYFLFKKKENLPFVICLL